MSNLNPSADSFIPFAVPDIGEEEIAAVVSAMRSGWLTTGPNVAEFERAFVKFLGREDLHAVAVNSATAGLHLALEAAGVCSGDEVLVPTWTFTSTAEVVRYLGATPVLVDIDPVTLCLDLVDAQKRVTQRTKAIMPVHFGGLMMDSGAVAYFAELNNLLVVEDAAHVLPGNSNGQMIGTSGSHACVFSFYATKTITTGEGGMVVTPDGDVARRMRTMRLHGINRDVFDRYTSTKPSWSYEVVAPGFKYNMGDLAGAIGNVQLARAWELRGKRAAIAARYSEQLAGTVVQLPVDAGATSLHSWHLYVIRLPQDFPTGRDEFIREMALRKIGCSVHFIPLHMQPYWRQFGQYQNKDFPVASREFQRAISLPLFSSMSASDVDRVIAAVRELAQ